MTRRMVGLCLVVLCLAGGLVRGLYLLERRQQPDFAQPQLDALYHDYWARALVTGDWTPPPDVADPEIRTHPYVRTPLYPYFLAGCYALHSTDPMAPLVLQALLGLANIVLIFTLGRRCFSPGAGLAAAAGCAFHWILIYSEGELVESTLVVTLVLLLLHAGQRWLAQPGARRAAIAGVALGLLALARPNTLLLAPCLLAWGWWRGRRAAALRPGRLLASALAVTLGCVLAVAPAAVRNYRASGELVLLTSTGGLNLYVGNNALADGYSGVLPGVGGWTSFDHPALVRRLSQELGRELTYSEAAREWGRRGWQEIATHPRRTLRLMGRKTLLFWGPREVSVEKEDELVRAESRVLRALPGGFAPVFALALVGLGLFLAERRRRPDTVAPPTAAMQDGVVSLCVVFVTVWFLSHLLFTVTGRYRVAILPPLFLLGGYGVARMAALGRARRWRPALAALLAATALAGAASINLAGYAPNRAKWHLTRGMAWGRAGEVDRATAELTRALELDTAARAGAARPPAATQAAQIHNALGVAMAVRGRPREALAHFEQALAFDPDLVDAHKNLARLLAKTGDSARALDHARRAVALRPDDAQACTQVGSLLLRAGQREEAAAQFRRALASVPGYPPAVQGLAAATAVP